jgi:hypothetical protein
LRQNFIIQKFISFSLCCLFVLSIVPASYLHTAFANHTDKTQTCKENNGRLHFHEEVINCHCDQVAITSAYTLPVLFFAESLQSFISPEYQQAGTIYFSQQHFSTKGRGPPFTA